MHSDIDWMNASYDCRLVAASRGAADRIGAAWPARSASWLRLAAAALVASALMAFSAFAEPVRTQGGLIDGVVEDGVTVFKGVPFAAPPVGDLRWRAPEPPATWEGVRRCDSFSPICMQRGMYPEDSPPEPTSEDCLYLNIWVPDGAQESALPVMVWIPGGGLQNGSASTPLYWGDELARRGVIVVTVNYRLGALGFLAHPELTAESPYKGSGNYGLLDQIAALAWVKRNIEAFGGDPDNLTVFGQSSGSISISALTTSPLARGLFRRAIGQSGGLFEPLEAAPEFELAGAEQVGGAFSARVGANSLQALRALPAEAIVAARFNPQPNIDGHVLTETPYSAYAHGRAHDIDILVGSNEQEGLYFIAGRTITAANFKDELSRDFPSFIVSLAGPKTPTDDAAAKAAFVEFEGGMRFGWNMRAWARLNERNGGGSTWFYRFAHTLPAKEGASHGADMAYVFGHLDLLGDAPSSDDQALAATMGEYWTNFARTGDPNGEGLPVWPKFAAADGRALILKPEIAVGALSDSAQLDSIDRLYSGVRIAFAYGYYILGAVGLLLLLVIWRIAAAIFRRPAAGARIRRSQS